ncbi:MAG: universal stress protein [Alphaproteobacteria bacterium]|jgi:nucleotide-binding universal stress UspA family protein|nr:universal stress protein [Alphaproteobacteria bacterium]
MFRDILLPVDLNHESSWRKALPVALKLVETFGARLHLMTVIPDFGMTIVGQFFPEGYEEKALETARQALHRFAQDHVPEDVAVQHIICHGTVYEEIIREAKAVGADLVVMTAHRPELRDYLLGPNAARVVRHAPVSVMVIRE